VPKARTDISSDIAADLVFASDSNVRQVSRARKERAAPSHRWRPEPQRGGEPRRALRPQSHLESLGPASVWTLSVCCRR